MKRPDLEHVVRASGAIAGASVVVVIGSQAILGSHPDPPPELTVSMEADVYVPEAPETADLITGPIGEFSPFHQTFGYFADGVDPGTATLPRGWEQGWFAWRTRTRAGLRRCASARWTSA